MRGNRDCCRWALPILITVLLAATSLTSATCLAEQNESPAESLDALPDLPLEQLEATARERQGGKEQDYDKALHDLFLAYRREGLVDKAAQTMQSLVTLREKTFGKTAAETLEAARELASFYSAEDRAREAYEVTRKYRDLVKEDVNVDITWLVALTEDLAAYTSDATERVALLTACADMFEEYLNEARTDDLLYARLLAYDVRKGQAESTVKDLADETARRLWQVHEKVLAAHLGKALAAKGKTEDGTETGSEALENLDKFYRDQALEEIGFLEGLFRGARWDDIYSREEIDAKALAIYENLEKFIVDERLQQADLLHDIRWKMVAACQQLGDKCASERLDGILKEIVRYDEERYRNSAESLLAEFDRVLEIYKARPALKADALERRRQEVVGLVVAIEADRRLQDSEAAEHKRRLEEFDRLANEAMRTYESAQPGAAGEAADRALALMSEAIGRAQDFFKSEQQFTEWLVALGDAHLKRSTVFELTTRALLAGDASGNLLRQFQASYVEHLQQGGYLHEALNVADRSLADAKRLWPGDRQHAQRLEAARAAVTAMLAPKLDRATLQGAISSAGQMSSRDRARLFNKVLSAGDMDRALAIARQALSESTQPDENDLAIAALLFVTAGRKADGILHAYLKRLAAMEIKTGQGDAWRLSPAALRLLNAAIAGDCGRIVQAIKAGRPIQIAAGAQQSKEVDGFQKSIQDALVRRLAATCYARAGDDAKSIASLTDDDTFLLSEVAASVRAKNWSLSYKALDRILLDLGDEARALSPADLLTGAAIAPGKSVRKLATGTYVSIAARVPEEKRPDTFDDHLLRAAQYSELAAAKAIAQAAARSMGDADLTALVRKRQELETLESARRLLQREGNSDVGREIEGLDRELKQRFPAYEAMLNPQSLGLDELRAMLASDEALVLTVETDAQLELPESLYVLIVTADGFHWYRAAMAPSSVREAVQSLRCGLDEEEWATEPGAERCGKLLGVSAKLDASRPLPFHLGKAYALYEAVLGPAASRINGKRLLVVPSGSLSSLPLHVLVTQRPAVPLPATFDAYRTVAWLGRSNPIAIVPSVASLASLRKLAQRNAFSEPIDSPGSTGAVAETPPPEDARRRHRAYLGYGDPLLAGSGAACQSETAPSPCLDAGQPERVARSDVKRAIIRGRGSRRSKGANVDEVFAGEDRQRVASAVRALCPLPDTADEIKCVARHFTEPKPLIRLSAEATEAELKSMSAGGGLAQFGILHFATHGLLAGDVERMTRHDGEPALVMTPPDRPGGEGDDGLLLASEVAALKLDADWVILSACNTAAGDKVGAEALSGLARAFFFAGARSLLVSHWPVYSDAAVRLTTHVFDELDRSPETSRADALRHSMLALMDDRSQEDNAHPAVWAPFVLVGDGR
jgi:CHAT domain-containing protein